ncbi:hypothetical protein BH20ACI3_BH20ACI3_04620 [soil metagenome]
MSPERGAEATHIFQGSLLLVSGVYYPIEVSPRWLQPLFALSPATYTLSACRKLVGIGNTDTRQPDGCAAFSSDEGIELALIGAVMRPLGLWVFGRIETWAKRTGKLKRTG